MRAQGRRHTFAVVVSQQTQFVVSIIPHPLLNTRLRAPQVRIRLLSSVMPRFTLRGGLAAEGFEDGLLV